LKPAIVVSSRVTTCTGEGELKLSRRTREPTTTNSVIGSERCVALSVAAFCVHAGSDTKRIVQLSAAVLVLVSNAERTARRIALVLVITDMSSLPEVDLSWAPLIE
jgi:hypothetical protein